MISRRTFLSLTVTSLAVRVLASVQSKSDKLVLYVNNGPEMLCYDVDVLNGVLARTDSIILPSAIQYAWPHVSHRCLYVATSDGAAKNFVTALRIDPQTGRLSKLGEPVPLSSRPINITTDIPSRYVLVAFSIPSGVKVYRVNKDLSVGDEIQEPEVTDGGIFAHQIRVEHDNRHAILVTRGVSATPTKPEDPGALKIFDYHNGALSREESVAPNGGIGFGPRHLDFHPTKPWVYVSLERESKLYMYRLQKGRIVSDALYRKETVADPIKIGPRQLAGAIHVHPNGHFVYVANRYDDTIQFNGQKVIGEGENSIVVYSIDQTTGEPIAIQHVDSRKIYPRTFSIDPSGRVMTVQHTRPAIVRNGNDVRVEPAGITVFRIGNDGKLTYVRGYDVEVEGDSQVFWGALVRL